MSVHPLIILIPLAAFALFCALLYMTGVITFSAWRTWSSPRVQVPAGVGRKWTREYDYDFAAADEAGVAGAPVYQQWVFWVSFDLGDRELELVVPEEAYIEIEEGDTGALCYKGEKFIAFRQFAGEATGPEAAKSPTHSFWRRGSRGVRQSC